MSKQKTKIDIDKINIFTHPRYMKVWGSQFTKACGSDTFGVAPELLRLNFLMEKFVKDYNFHMEELANTHQADAHVKDYRRLEEE